MSVAAENAIETRSYHDVIRHLLALPKLYEMATTLGSSAMTQLLESLETVPYTPAEHCVLEGYVVPGHIRAQKLGDDGWEDMAEVDLAASSNMYPVINGAKFSGDSLSFEDGSAWLTASEARVRITLGSLSGIGESDMTPGPMPRDNQEG